MRDLTKKSTNRPTSQIGRLEAIHRLINGKPYNQDLIECKLSEINVDYLTPYCTVYYKYLNARHHFNCYREEGVLEHLELSSSLLDDMDRFARANKVRITNFEYHFTRAYVKLLMVKFSWDDYYSPFHLDKARFITNTALRFNPEHQSFNWLKAQLSA